MHPYEAALRVPGRELLIREIDLLPSGHLRLLTEFTYPDGSSVDLFLVRSEDGGFDRVSDLGSTLELIGLCSLDDVDEGTASAAAENCGGVLRAGMLEKLVGSAEEVWPALRAVLHACLCVVDTPRWKK